MIRRAVAYFVDWMLLATGMNILVVAVAFGLTGKLYAGLLPLVFFEAPMQIILLAVLAAIELLYYCGVPRYVWKGQTLGKRIMGVQVRRADGGRASLPTLVLRDLVCIVLIEGCFSPLSNYVRNALMLVCSSDVIQMTIWASWALGAISIGMMLFTKRHRMLHDVLSGTIVVGKRTEAERGADESPVDGAVE